MERTLETDRPEDLDPREVRAIEQLKRGDIDGLAYLVRKHELLAVRAAVLVTCDRALAEDVVQEAFIRAYKRISQFRADRPFRPWFMRSVVNAALRAARRRDRQRPLGQTQIEGIGSRGNGRGELPEAALEQAETSREIWQALNSMTPKKRAVLVLHYFAGLSVRDLASVSGSPEGTVKWRLSAARTELKRSLIFNREQPSEWNGQGANK